MRAPVHPALRILARIDVTEPGCWIWPGAKNRAGYGQVIVAPVHCGRDKRRVMETHRVLYEWFIGPIPPKLYLDHLCEVKSCCNPVHLEPVTPRENVRRWGARSVA